MLKHKTVSHYIMCKIIYNIFNKATIKPTHVIFMFTEVIQSEIVSLMGKCSRVVLACPRSSSQLYLLSDSRIY